MADLARGASGFVGRPSTDVIFEVRHVDDRPGYLLEVFSSRDGTRQTFHEFLCANLNGVAFLSGIRRTLPDGLLMRQHGSSSPVVAQHQAVPEGSRFTGAARPNPSFIYESASRYEALISLDMNARQITEAHARSALDALERIAHISANVANVPILSLQYPVQMPSERTHGERPLDRIEGWPLPNAIAIRVVFALREADSRRRMVIARALNDFCAPRGYGLWLGDLRAGHAQGNWFSIRSESRHKISKELEAQRRRHGDSVVSRVLPLTVLGPARIGSTHAVISLLRCAPELGIVGCAISSLEDLAFIHLQLTCSSLNSIVPSAYLHDESDTGIGHRLRQTVGAIGGTLLHADVPDGSDGDGHGSTPASRLSEKAGDYQVLVGRVHSISSSLATTVQRAVWFSWTEVGEPEWSVVLTALNEAVCTFGLSSPTAGAALHHPNLEYLVCRTTGGISRVRGKLTVPSARIADVDSPLEYGASKFCVRVEDAWRALLDKEGCAAASTITLAWREHFLGHSPWR